MRPCGLSRSETFPCASGRSLMLLVRMALRERTRTTRPFSPRPAHGKARAGYRLFLRVQGLAYAAAVTSFHSVAMVLLSAFCSDDAPRSECYTAFDGPANSSRGCGKARFSAHLHPGGDSAVQLLDYRGSRDARGAGC